jgi:hypothetical protein
VSWIGIILKPIRIWILPLVLHMLENKKKYIHRNSSLHCCVFYDIVIGVINSNYAQYIEIFRENYSLKRLSYEIDFENVDEN